jgi:hypothetical protein
MPYFNTRKSERPAGSCNESPRWWSDAHRWEWSATWNGNDRRVLPFWNGKQGISRPGWRCFNCGKMAWDNSDDEFALAFAFRMGLIQYPPTVKGQAANKGDPVDAPPDNSTPLPKIDDRSIGC